MDFLILKENFYFKIWIVYLKNFIYIKMMMDFVEEVVFYVMIKIMKDGFRSSFVFCVFGVGSGKGKIDFRIFVGIVKVFGVIQMKKVVLYFVVVELSVEMIGEFMIFVFFLLQFLVGVVDVLFEWYEMIL